MSSVAGEGLTGLAGVLVVVFFLSAGTAFLLGLFAPAFFSSASGWLMPAFLLMGAAACAAYLVSQRRESRRMAQVQAELHKLNERNGAPRPDTDDAIEEFSRAWKGKLGLEEFRAEELHAAAQPQRNSQEGLLVAVLLLLIVCTMASVLISTKYDLWVVVMVGTIAVGGIVGVVVQRLGVRLDARSARRELK